MTSYRHLIHFFIFCIWIDFSSSLSHMDLFLAPNFDVGEAAWGNDHRGQIKTLYTGINPTKTRTVMERTVPSYDKEDPMMVGLGQDEMWEESKGKGRGWGNGIGARHAFQV